MSLAKPINYSYDVIGDVTVNEGCAPFDGKPVLIKLSRGWVEAFWVPSETVTNPYTGTEHEGFCWCCLDDDMQAEFDEATYWCELPGEVQS